MTEKLIWPTVECVGGKLRWEKHAVDMFEMDVTEKNDLMLKLKRIVADGQEHGKDVYESIVDFIIDDRKNRGK